MAEITFDDAIFRASFCAFSDATLYPQSKLQSYFDAASCYVSPNEYGRLRGDCRLRALNLMTAHLIALSDMIAQGNTPSQVTSATIDKISVSMQPPASKGDWLYWLNLTPYGMQLNALLSAKSAGGLYVGGVAERSGFRRAFGGFNG